jgi:hypothetical protein
MQFFPYEPDPLMRGQWWHFLAALSSVNDDREYAVQFTYFMFGGRLTLHKAITSIHEGWRKQEIVPALEIPQRVSGKNFFINDEVKGVPVNLIFAVKPRQAPVEYPSKDTHWGYPRLGVAGVIGDVHVGGPGCFDREIFNKKLLPGEEGWVWQVAWMDNGDTSISYRYTGESPRETMHYGRSFSMKESPVRLGPAQAWRRGNDLAFSYVEEMVSIVSGENTGRGFREIVLSAPEL